MKFKKLLLVLSSLTLLTPLITLTTACQQSDNKKDIAFLNANIAQALKLYDDKGISLIQQYLFDQYDKNNIEKYRIQAGTRCLDFNSFPDFDQNSLLFLKQEDYTTYPELNDFMSNVLKIPKNESQFYDWTTCSLIKIRVAPESCVAPNDISLQFNAQDKILDFQAPARICNIEFYNSKTNQVLAKYKINVASSFLKIANQEYILINENDINYDSINFHNLSIYETGKTFNDTLSLKDHILDNTTINTQELAKILHAEITFKLYDMDEHRLVVDQEALNNTTNYAIGFELNGIYVKTIFRIGQRTDPITNN